MEKVARNVQSDGIIIDLDGTVYKGRQEIEGAAAAIDYLRSRGKRLAFLSNRGNISRTMCCEKLAGMGIRVEAQEVLLTSTVTAMYLSEHHPGCKVWVLGEQGLVDELLLAGLMLADEPEQAEWLVITLHESLTYRDLNMAFRAVRGGARIIATNADRTFPGDDGDAIDVAGMIGAITNSTGREVEIVIGKPSRYMSEAALRLLDVPAERCLIVGDSLESDIGLGKASGMQTALVLSGSTKREQLEAVKDQPDWVWDSLADIVDYL